MNKKLNNIFKGDKVIWMVFFFLCIISIIEVFSASSSLTYKGQSYWGPIIKHCVIFAIGIVCTIIVMNVRCQYYKIITPFLLILSIVFLLLVLLPGHAVNDGSRWINLG
ncbi:MAG: FtsW/RodA/SpoVE family cell cycle protein, partial [Prevotella sp.]|nr:FtsW/RodA/SpoVE family cell cycle protein [Prevotella sp.]